MIAFAICNFLFFENIEDIWPTTCIALSSASFFSNSLRARSPCSIMRVFMRSNCDNSLISSAGASATGVTWLAMRAARSR